MAGEEAAQGPGPAAPADVDKCGPLLPSAQTIRPPRTLTHACVCSLAGDDEFEEFEVQDWAEAAEAPEEAQQWEARGGVRGGGRARAACAVADARGRMTGTTTRWATTLRSSCARSWTRRSEKRCQGSEEGNGMLLGGEG